MKVTEIMNKAMVVDDDISVKQAARIMSDKGIGCLLIMHNDKVVGIITERDVMKNVDKLNNKVSSIMSKNVIVIEGNENLDEAAELMKEHNIKKLPVMNKGKLVGIITATDLIANSNSLNENFMLE